MALISHSYDNITVPTRIGIFGTSVVLQLHNTLVYPRELVIFFYFYESHNISSGCSFRLFNTEYILFYSTLAKCGYSFDISFYHLHE